MSKSKQPRHPYLLEEPEASYASRLRPIGNSRGVILYADLLSKAGLDTSQDLLIQAAKGAIIIVQAKSGTSPDDLDAWDNLFQQAKKKGQAPEKDLFEGMENKFDREEW